MYVVNESICSQQACKVWKFTKWISDNFFQYFWLLSARYTRVCAAFSFQYFIFVGGWMVFSIAQHPTHCISCIQVWYTMHLLSFSDGSMAKLQFHHPISDIKIVQWWADQVFMILPASWMQTHWLNVKERAGSNWPSTCCHSSTTYTGNYDMTHECDKRETSNIDAIHFFFLSLHF